MAALKYWKSVLQWFFILLIIGFLLYTLYMNWEELKGYHFQISWGYFLISYIFLFLHFVLFFGCYFCLFFFFFFFIKNFFFYIRKYSSGCFDGGILEYF